MTKGYTTMKLSSSARSLLPITRAGIGFRGKLFLPQFAGETGSVDQQAKSIKSNRQQWPQDWRHLNLQCFASDVGNTFALGRPSAAPGPAAPPPMLSRRAGRGWGPVEQDNIMSFALQEPHLGSATLSRAATVAM